MTSEREEGFLRKYRVLQLRVGNMLSRYQGPEAELSWESKGSVAVRVRGQEKDDQEPYPAVFQPG